MGQREIIYLSLNCHHQNDTCIKTGGNANHFNVSLNCERQSHKTVSTNYNLLKRKEKKKEPKQNRAEARLLTNLTPYR